MTKKELRSKLRERRGAIPPEQKKEFDSAILSHIVRSELFQKASMILLYVPIESEVSLLELSRTARSMGKPIAFPRCNTETETMEFYTLLPEARLSPGAYHIPEPPADAPVCVPDEHALCILPGLSFDVFGNRLGYGKGYYDKYLESFPGVTMGVLYASTMLKRVPTDEHDRPVHCLVTEHGLILPEKDETRPPQPKKKAQKKKKLRMSPDGLLPKVGGFLKKCGTYLLALARDARSQGEDGVRALHMPQGLVLVTFLMLLFSRGVEAKFLDRGNEYIGVILLQILIFLLPAILYCKLRGTRFIDRIRISPIRPTHIPLVLLVLVLMITGGMLTSIITGGIESLTGKFTLYNTFTSRTGTPIDVVYSILAYAVLPAIGEELIYRSILCTEYEKYGVGVSVSVSALCFAMLHFSFEHFFTYLFLGVLLAAAMYATHSFLAPLLLHLFYNVFCLFGQPYLSTFYVHAGSNEIFVFCLIVIFLLTAAFTVGEARKIYHVYAISNADSSYTVSVPLKEYPKRVLYALFTPVFAAALLLFLILAIVNLF
ncbi:MAG: 5-formyltetrahydrofolate cyclo-ligase [Ruminococcaceae bacterium]|nr:5-formyltetrahydrofolate cyclo-ligase [Oscillospiraceae bacterium]